MKRAMQGMTPEAEGALRAAIVAALPYTSPAMIAKRDAFTREAVGLAPLLGWAVRLHAPATTRASLGRLAAKLAAVQEELAADVMAAGLVTGALARRGTRATGPAFPERPHWAGGLHPSDVAAIVAELRAATADARRQLKDVRPHSQTGFVRAAVAELARAYGKHFGRPPTGSAGKPFDRLARAYCRAAGLRGLTRAVLLAALAEAKAD